MGVGSVHRNSFNNNTIRSEMSTWLESHSWDLFITYTFKEHFNFSCAKRAVERHYKRTKKLLGIDYPFFYIVEPHSNYALSGTHVHGLLGKVGDVKNSGKKLQQDWESHRGHGILEFRKYQVEKGASKYLTKYLIKSDYDSSYWNIYNV